MSKAVVGIDFGTSGTGYAFSYNNPNDIIMGQFSEQGIDAKVPTEIILDSRVDKILAFGHLCQKYIEDNQLKNGELYFKNIKMNLYNNIFKIKPLNNSKAYELVDIIAKILEYIKEEAYSQISGGHPEIKLNQIKWVVTVPAIWDYSQKGIMIQASEKAGLFNEYTERLNFLALEPESASLFCSQDETIKLDFASNGKTYIICDLGGGTGDIATHKKDENGEVIEKYPAIGGNYGSEEIDKQMYHEVIRKIFGFEHFQDLKEKNKNIKEPWDEDILLIEWTKLLKEIQVKKKIEVKKEDQTKEPFFLLNCMLFKDFSEGNDLQALVDKYNQSCRKNWKVEIHQKSRWWLKFPYQIFYDLINDHALKILDLLITINDEVEDIESIIYVGGYSSNKYLFSSIKKNFRDVEHLVPARPEIAVIKGAVLFGLNPKIIKSRKAPYTIGFNCDHIWNESIHGKIGIKYYDKYCNSFKCKNTFDKFIEIGEDIKIGHKIIRHFYTMNSRFIYLKFFKTKKKKPILWTENEIDLLGEDKLDLERDYPPGQRNFTIILEFGGTFVEAKCIHKISNKSISLKLYFIKNN